MFKRDFFYVSDVFELDADQWSHNVVSGNKMFVFSCDTEKTNKNYQMKFITLVFLWTVIMWYSV